MRRVRNPFRFRASERIESDETFLRLFGPPYLDVLSMAEDLWKKPHIFRSAPGGGKTSLMRVFTPSSLITLHTKRTDEDLKELYQNLRDMGVFDDAGPRLLGLLLSCARNYATLADLDFDQSRQDRLFFGLLNSRILLSTLRGVLTLRGLDYPGPLHRISIAPSIIAETLPMLKFPCNGKEIYDWARTLEAKVSETLDSLEPSHPELLQGHETLISLEMMRPDLITLDGERVVDHVIVMLDDVHKLTSHQRERLLEAVIELRVPIGTWIAERFDALSTEEIISPGATEGRDYVIINLEDFWRKKVRKGKDTRFEKMVLNIADRRSRFTSDVEIGSFRSCLQNSLEGEKYEQKFLKVIEAVAGRVRSSVGKHPLFQEWVADREAIAGTSPGEQAIAWRTLEVLIEREKRKAQKSLFDFALSTDELEEKDDSQVRAAAELFLAEEFGLPFYFGPSRLSVFASSNIEQFLWFAGDIFEEVISAAIIRKPMHITPDRQDAILKKAVRKRWNEIPRKVRNGREVRNLLDAIGNFAKWETFKLNAPYSPGVTGIAISMADLNKLLDSNYQKHDPRRSKLKALLASALANNLLEPRVDYRCKGENWMVLYLNRWLCIHFGLHFQYGGWRPQKIDDLCQWLENGFKAPNEGNESLLKGL